MDDTQASLKATEAAAATRKRRSSILKSQRPPRTPFSELEFNVATPTDTAKSRRVSFSRRTGVAEFVTNEATTTWKNFYEEHNKSLESSGNESAANARPVIEHIGKRIFDQQFEEVEVVDIGGTLQTNTVHDFQTSLSTVNLHPVESTEDIKLYAPIQNFDLSSLTEHHTKVFGDDLSIPLMTEMSNPININFSTLQPMSSKCDDLEEIQRDLERSNPSNVVCPGPFAGRRDLSEYIEIDLNMTSVGVRNEDCDMSITDTIHSPKVQEVVKINTSSVKEKKLSINDDWAVDKENIVLNPYTTPKESLNFAINDEPNEVLVFDGKKLTVQTEKKTLDVENIPMVPKNVDATPKRKTIVLNTNDDLPNFIPDSSLMVNQNSNPPKDIVEAKRSVIYNDFDLSITQAVDNKIDIPKRKTIVFDDDMGNISITQAVPAKVIIEKPEKRKTILFENDMNLSITQAVPTNIISANKIIVEKRKTIVFEDGDISYTKALPTNLILNENTKPSQDRTVYFQDGLDISVTQAIPENIIANLDKTESIKNDLTNLSMTQAIPTNIISNDNKNTDVGKEGKTIIYGNQDIDTTQVCDNAVISNKASEKRKTIVYEQDTGNISITQAVPAGILLDIKNNFPNTNTSKILENSNNSLFNFNANSESVKTHNTERDVIKNITIYDDKIDDVSFTKAVSTNILQSSEQEQNAMEESCDISITRALPTNILQQAAELNKSEIKTLNNADIIPIENKNTASIANLDKTTVKYTSINSICDKSKVLEESKFFNNDLSNISMTKPIPTEILIQNQFTDKCEIGANISNFENNKSLSFAKDAKDVLKLNELEQNDMEVSSCDISMTRALPTNIISQAKESNMADILEPLNNITLSANVDKTAIEDISISKIGNITKLLEESKFYNNDVSNLSMTKPIPIEIIALQNELSDKCEIETNKSMFKENNASINQDILIYQAVEQNITKSNEIDKSYSKLEDDGISSDKSIADNQLTKQDISYSFNKNAVDKESNNKTVNYSIKNDKTCEEKELDRESLNEMELMSICTNKSVHVEQNTKSKKSILNELLDMSSASINEEIKSPVKDDIEGATTDATGIKILTNNIKTTAETESNDSMFVIKDSGNDLTMNTEKIKENINSTKNNILSKDKDESDQDMYLQQKVEELKTVNEETRKSLNRHYERVVSSDLRKSINIDKSTVENDLNTSKARKSFKNADDTKELLEMLSDFTDGQAVEQDKNKSVALNLKNSTTLETKTEPRFSIIPKRQSIALSREDLLNNISMAQAALQQSRFEIDESGSIEETQDTSEDEEDFQSKQSPRKSVRMSTDVVKTLQFEEDDTVTDVSMNADMDMSPLKKTTFGEVSYIKEDKARVIPSYLKDVSDGIKALMHDLVKPMADTPHETDELNNTRNIPSTCSTQIQANLITSSQIDIDVELLSTQDSVDKIESKQSIVTKVAAVGNKAISNALRQSIKPASSQVSLEIEQKPTFETKIKVSVARQSMPSPVILFDHSNPLNNILLNQSYCTNVHKYNPISSNMDTDGNNVVIDSKNKINKLEVENVSLHYNVESKIIRHQSILQSDDTSEGKCEFKSVDSNISKPLSVDRSTEGIVSVKDTEVNTLIAMKGNQDLLESNSSLTLVDDALAQSAFDIKVETVSDDGNQKSPLHVIYKMETDEQLHKIDSDFTSNDDFETEDLNENQNTRKRSYSPTKEKHKLSRPNVEITPKPLSKMQKISNSPQNKFKEQITPKPEFPSPNKSKSPNKKSPKKQSPKKQDVITVQQLFSECYRDTIDQKLDKRKLQVLKDSPSETLDTETLSRIESATSVDTVSLKTKETEVSSVGSREVTVVGSNVSRVDWQPDVVDDLSSKNLLTECSSSANVVAKINTLPFMGSRDCEWESSGGDVWMFRLLRSRVRLTVRLAHSHHNASRSRVRADTALVAVTVDPVQDEKDPLAALCVRLTSESMRRECARCVRAGDVPTLLRRCVSVARVALLWARVMRDARVRLAYSVTPGGVLTLKVANVPLRAVWEVRLVVELAGDSGVAWPRVSHARVEPVLAGSRTPSPPRLARLVEHVPGDWGHVPSVLWKVFRYLKNKTREDDLLGF